MDERVSGMPSKSAESGHGPWSRPCVSTVPSVNGARRMNAKSTVKKKRHQLDYLNHMYNSVPFLEANNVIVAE